MNKLQDHAFKKDVYLLGADIDGIKYWLEAPTWDCDWYWGFGYVETYRDNRKPSTAVDIDSHQQADGAYVPDNASSDDKLYPQEYRGDSDLFTGDFLVEKTFSDKEAWRLRELMATFYQLKKTAAMFGQGGMHIADNLKKELLQDAKLAENINQKLIPEITGAILAILTPEVK